MSLELRAISSGIISFPQECSLSLPKVAQQTECVIEIGDCSKGRGLVRKSASLNSLPNDIVRLIAHLLDVKSYVALTKVSRRFRFLGSEKSLALYLERELFIFRKTTAPKRSRFVEMLSVIPIIGSVANCIRGCRVQEPKEAETACHAYNWRLTRLTSAMKKAIIAQEALRSKIQVLKLRARHFTLAGLSSLTGLIGTQILVWHPVTRPPLSGSQGFSNVVTGGFILVWSSCAFYLAYVDRSDATKAKLELDTVKIQATESDEQEESSCDDEDLSVQQLQQGIRQLTIDDIAIEDGAHFIIRDGVSYEAKAL
jgi:hypothetical protein